MHLFGEMLTFNDKQGIPGNHPAFDAVDVIFSPLYRRNLDALFMMMNSRMRTLDRALWRSDFRVYTAI